MSKYNIGKQRHENYHDSAIWKYLHNEVDEMLTSELSESYQKKAYVNNIPIEDRLSVLLRKSTNSRYYLLSGLTGSGKTTIMRHVFFRDKNVDRPIITNKNLIIAFDFDVIIEDNNPEELFENLFVNEISHATKIIQDKYSIDETSDQEFVDFFTKNSTGLVQYLKNGKRVTKSEIRNDLYENHKLYSMIAELCIALNNPKCRINNVIFIVDNIESLGIDKSKFDIPLLTAHKVINFMFNKSIVSRGKPKWTPNILICCRHYVYRIINTWCDDGTLSQIFESFCQHDKIDLDSPVSLRKIVEKRYEAYSQTITKSKIVNTKKKHSLEIIRDTSLQIISETEIDGRNLLVDLNLSNLRSSLQTLREIIYNKRWIQRDNFEEEGMFSIDSGTDFNTRLPYILRAIGMKCGNVFFSENCLIPNLLKNKPNNDINIYALLALKYFLLHDSSWTEPLNINDFYNDVIYIFGDKLPNKKNTKETFEFAIWLLLSNRILLRSADQEQRELVGITLDNYKQIQYVYVSNVAYDYIYLLEDNSVLLEMLMDDIFIDDQILRYPSDYKASFKSFNKGGYLLSLRYLEKIILCEYDLYVSFYSREKSDEYYSKFGREFISEIILKGLTKSFEVYFREERSEEYLYKNACTQIIGNIQKMIDNIYRK